MTNETLRFYAENAATYATRTGRGIPPQLPQFLARLPSEAKLLELGTGGGQDALYMIEQGFSVTPTDGSPELAAEASRLLGLPVRTMLFEDLEDTNAFDAVYANACLLHAPRESLPAILIRIHRALKPGGLFWASYKSGDAEGEDKFGRYYNYVSKAELRSAYAAAHWQSLSISTWHGSGYDDLPTPWLGVIGSK
jgi:SAM-dependent methyltransferase